MNRVSIFHMSVHFIKVELPLSLPKDNSISSPMAMIMAMIIIQLSQILRQLLLMEKYIR